MKKIAGLSFISIFVFLFSIQTGVTSCTKERLYDTVTIVKNDTTVIRDTTVIKDTVLSLQILTANPWKLQELRGLTGNNTTYYLRGGLSNSESFDNEYIVFNSDKTGSYIENNGRQSPLTWDFANSGNTKIIYTVQFPSLPTTITWDYIIYKNGAITYDEYFAQNGVNSHFQGIRIAK